MRKVTVWSCIMQAIVYPIGEKSHTSMTLDEGHSHWLTK